MRNKWVWASALVLIFGFLILHVGCSRRAVHDKVNAYGIREDVEAGIAKSFPNSAKERAIAREYAKAFQIAIENPDNAMEINSKYQERADACSEAVFPQGYSDIKDYRDEPAFVAERLVSNTYIRNLAYLQYNKGLSGHMFDSPPADLRACDFDPSKMDN